MTSHALTLRGGFSVFSGALVMAALLACGALIASSAVLFHLNSATATNVESVRATQEVKIDLLEHKHQRDSDALRRLEDDMLTQLQNERQWVTTPQEAALLSDAYARVQEYVDQTHEGADEVISATREAAFDAVDALVTENSRQTYLATLAAGRWNRATTALAFSVAALLTAVTLGSLWWLRRYGIQPIAGLSAAMVRFGHGDRRARAQVLGAAELRDAAEQFNHLAGELAAQREAQLTFYAGVAHDLKTPLTTLKLAVAMIRPDRPLPPEAQVRNTLKRVGKQVLRLERMVADVIDLSSVERGRLELQLQSKDLAALVREGLELFDLDSPGGRLALSISGEPMRVRCDPMRVEQVLYNLVTNALKYSPPESPVEIRVHPVAARACIEVCDHGPGISRTDIERIFEPFRRVGGERAKVAGAGLGLFISRQIVDAHGGRVELDSTPGHGSVFKVWLPLEAVQNA